MKKSLSLLLAILMLMSVVPMAASAYETEGYYKYDVKNGEATIYGVDKSISGTVHIPDTLGGYPVTGIYNAVFKGCKDITGVFFPKSLVSIGDKAFSECTGIEFLYFNDGLVSIGDEAFSECTELIRIIIPDSTVSIGMKAFFGCSDVGTIELGKGLTSIGSGAFAGCKNAGYSVSIPKNVTTIENSLFYDCGLMETVIIPESVTVIEDWAFYNCGVTKVRYTGTEAQWKKITIGIKNENLEKARVEYNVHIHDYEEVEVPATCTKDGYIVKTCSCGDSYTSLGEIKKGHAYTVVTTPVTCTEDGKSVYTCHCGDTYTLIDFATGHRYENAVCNKCGDSKADDCGHLCHKGGFWYKLCLFFWKLFKTNKECSCGMYHY